MQLAGYLYEDYHDAWSLEHNVLKSSSIVCNFKIFFVNQENVSSVCKMAVNYRRRVWTKVVTTYSEALSQNFPDEIKKHEISQNFVFSDRTSHKYKPDVLLT